MAKKGHTEEEILPLLAVCRNGTMSGAWISWLSDYRTAAGSVF